MSSNVGYSARTDELRIVLLLLRQRLLAGDLVLHGLGAGERKEVVAGADLLLVHHAVVDQLVDEVLDGLCDDALDLGQLRLELFQRVDRFLKTTEIKPLMMRAKYITFNNIMQNTLEFRGILRLYILPNRCFDDLDVRSRGSSRWCGCASLPPRRASFLTFPLRVAFNRARVLSRGGLGSVVA